jgi:hypothetical protein
VIEFGAQLREGFEGGGIADGSGTSGKVALNFLLERVRYGHEWP